MTQTVFGRAGIGTGLVVMVALAVVFSGVVMGTAVTADTGGQAVTQQSEPGGFDGATNLSTADAKLNGEDVNDTAGRSVSNAGDVNGDGVADVIVGAPENDTGGPNAGAAYVVYGPVEADEVSLSDADVKLVGAATSDRAGQSVSTAGDVDGDGLDDVVVGSPGNDSAAENAGAAYVVYGNESLPAEMNLTEADAVLEGDAAGDRAGWSVSNATSDGAPAVLVGAPFADTGDGTAYVLAGEDANGTVALGADATATLTGATGDQAGWSVASAGDVNGDGVSDVVVGAHNWTDEENQAASAGAAYLLYGDLSGETSLADANATLTGVDTGDRAGWAVSNAGDVNDDNVSDVVVGAPFADPDGTNAAGSAYTLYGASDLEGNISLADADRRLDGGGENDLAGYAVSGARDVTCDGVDDLLVGAPANDTGGDDAGAAYLVSGGESLSGNQSLASAGATFHGEAPGDRAGHAVSGAGDVDNESASDVVVGAPRNDTGGDDAGAAYLLYSDCPEVTEETPTATEEPADTPTATATATEEPETPTEEPSTPTEGPTTPADEPKTATEEPETPTEEPATLTEEPETPTEQPTSPTEEPETSTEESSTPTEEPTTPTEEPVTSTEEPTTPTEEPETPTEEPTTTEEPGTPADEETESGNDAADGDTDVQMVDICHKTYSEEEPWIPMTVREDTVTMHLDFGDFLVDENNPCPPEDAGQPDGSQGSPDESDSGTDAGDESGADESTTEAPDTEEPTEPPATEEPSPDEPVTEEPSTEESTEPPATEEPSTEAPSTDEPTTEPPATEDSAGDESGADDSTTDTSTTEAPDTADEDGTDA